MKRKVVLVWLVRTRSNFLIRTKHSDTEISKIFVALTIWILRSRKLYNKGTPVFKNKKLYVHLLIYIFTI